MARRKDLLSEAIADAKAVKETALANAKLALEEAFTPKLQSMISAKLAEEAEEDDEMDEELDSSEIENDSDLTEEDEMESDDEMYSEEDEMESDDEEYDITGDEEEETEEDDDLDLESVIAELEAEMGDDEMDEELDSSEIENDSDLTEEDEMESEEEIDLDEVIKTLREMSDDESEEEMSEEEDEDMAAELEEAYNTIKSLKATINEVNLLNAKLLYTNKLFRTFDLNESQKVKVLENFDRTTSVREVKLVFSTIAENLNVAKKKKSVVKEGYASKATKSSAPKKIISEGNEMAARWKKLAGLK
jgi:hypothetical protein